MKRVKLPEGYLAYMESRLHLEAGTLFNKRKLAILLALSESGPLPIYALWQVAGGAFEAGQSGCSYGGFRSRISTLKKWRYISRRSDGTYALLAKGRRWVVATINLFPEAGDFYEAAIRNRLKREGIDYA